MNNTNSDAMNKAKAIYNELSELYINHDREFKNYLDVAQKYATLKSKRGDIERNFITVFGLNDKTYSMSTMITFDHDYIRFTEDCAMMVYRLNNGQGYNTYELANVIRR